MSIDVVTSLREMIGGMYAVYAIDLSIQLGLFENLANTKLPIPIDVFLLKMDGDNELLLDLLKAIHAAGVIKITEKKEIDFEVGWKAALTDTASVDYIATLPRCYIAPTDDFRKFKDVFMNGGRIPWQSLSSSIIDAVSADAIRSANYFIEAVTKQVDGLKEKLLNGSTIYDIGCAAGHSTFKLAKAFPNSKVVGIDILDNAIKLAKDSAKKESLPNVSFQRLSATDLPESVADVIILNDVFHEMDVNLRFQALKKIKSSLRSGGGLFFCDPLAPATISDNCRPEFKMHNITMFFESPYGAKVYTRSEIEKMIGEAGFDHVIDVGSSESQMSVYLTV